MSLSASGHQQPSQSRQHTIPSRIPLRSLNHQPRTTPRSTNPPPPPSPYLHILTSTPLQVNTINIKPHPSPANTTMTNPLSKKLILITGASRGIGLSISQKFAHAGGNLILVSRTKSHLDAALSKLPPGGEHQSITGDVGDPEFWEEVRGGCGVRSLPWLVNENGGEEGGGQELMVVGVW